MGVTFFAEALAGFSVERPFWILSVAKESRGTRYWRRSGLEMVMFTPWALKGSCGSVIGQEGSFTESATAICGTRVNSNGPPGNSRNMKLPSASVFAVMLPIASVTSFNGIGSTSWAGAALVALRTLEFVAGSADG